MPGIAFGGFGGALGKASFVGCCNMHFWVVWFSDVVRCLLVVVYCWRLVGLFDLVVMLAKLFC